jgi:hypothetical protein
MNNYKTLQLILKVVSIKKILLTYCTCTCVHMSSSIITSDVRASSLQYLIFPYECLFFV